jgi:nitroreductase
MIRAFTGEPLPAGTTERLLKAATRAPSAGFSQGYSFLVLADPVAPARASERKSLAELVHRGHW